MPRWNPTEGNYRAAGEGPLGIHQGSCVWTLVAAEDRRKALSEHVPRTWVETFTDGAWKRHGEVVHTEPSVTASPNPAPVA